MICFSQVECTPPRDWPQFSSWGIYGTALLIHIVLLSTAITPPGLDKPDMVLTQKATLERTSEWAEKAAALISANQPHSVHRASASDSSKDTSSHRSSKPAVESRQSPLGSPSGMNPRDIPLELRGGTARDPRDPPPRDPRGERDDREPGEIPDDRIARTEQRRETRDMRESRDVDTSGRQQRTGTEDRWEHRASAKTEKDQDTEKTTQKKDFDSTDRDIDLEFDTWTSSKSVERKRTDSKTKLSPRSLSPPSKQQSVSKKPSSGKLSSERGLDEDAEPGVYY